MFEPLVGTLVGWPSKVFEEVVLGEEDLSGLEVGLGKEVHDAQEDFFIDGQG